MQRFFLNLPDFPEPGPHFLFRIGLEGLIMADAMAFRIAAGKQRGMDGVGNGGVYRLHMLAEYPRLFQPGKMGQGKQPLPIRLGYRIQGNHAKPHCLSPAFGRVTKVIPPLLFLSDKEEINHQPPDNHRAPVGFRFLLGHFFFPAAFFLFLYLGKHAIP